MHITKITFIDIIPKLAAMQFYEWEDVARPWLIASPSNSSHKKQLRHHGLKLLTNVPK